jgi:hypothetical protein
MRTTMFILKTIVIAAALSALVSAEATACPEGYFTCGRACCPTR